MIKQPSIDTSGKPFDDETIEAVWNKAPVSREHPPLRLDPYGALIWKEGYGNTSSKLGWGIRHLKPSAKGGGDDLDNLQPVQWENTRRNGET